MAKIVGLEGLTHEDLAQELDRGARFVVYQYCVSVLVLTFTRGTNIYFVRSDESRMAKGLPWTALSLAFGWWGFPFGLIFTPVTVIRNLLGGKDVTDEVLAALYPNGATDEPVFEAAPA
ncbi:MAG TPA: hypothetical protein VF170_12035 [Planctomycetaceae bacterium]